MTELEMIARAEMAEEMGITLAEYDRLNRRLARYSPYNEDPQPIECPFHGECGDCYAANCEERS